METIVTLNHRLDRTVHEIIYRELEDKSIEELRREYVKPEHVRWDGDHPYLLMIPDPLRADGGGHLDLRPLIERTPPKFAISQTRLIGITKAELEALKRGATLILGQPREGMQPISAGQELLAIVGYVPGDTPRMDAERVRLRVIAAPFEIWPLQMNMDEIARLTANPVLVRALSDIEMTAYLQAVCAELKSFDPSTPKISIPVEVIP